MARDRNGKFWWEQNNYRRITLASMGGTYDTTLSTDCRCCCSCRICALRDLCGAVLPWIAMGSIENWGEEVLTPEGLPDGDMPHFDMDLIPHELFCNIHGDPYAESEEYDISEDYPVEVSNNPEIFLDDRYNPNFVYLSHQKTWVDEPDEYDFLLIEKMSSSLKKASRKITRRICHASYQNGKRGNGKYKRHPHIKRRGEDYMASVEEVEVLEI